MFLPSFLEASSGFPSELSASAGTSSRRVSEVRSHQKDGRIGTRRKKGAPPLLASPAAQERRRAKCVLELLGDLQLAECDQDHAAERFCRAPKKLIADGVDGKEVVSHAHFAHAPHWNGQCS